MPWKPSLHLKETEGEWRIRKNIYISTIDAVSRSGYDSGSDSGSQTLVKRKHCKLLNKGICQINKQIIDLYIYMSM